MRTAASYSGLQIALHWTIAALVIFQLLVNDGMQAAWRAYSRGGEAADTQGWAWLHVAVGVSILLLALLRVYIRQRAASRLSTATNRRRWSGSPTRRIFCSTASSSSCR